MEVSNSLDTPQCDRVSIPMEGFQAWHSSLSKAAGLQLVVNSSPQNAGALVSRNSQVPSLIIKDLSAKLSQLDKAVGDLQKSFDQLRSDVCVPTTPSRLSSTTSSIDLNSRELSTAALASAASVCECRNYCVAEAYCRRLSAVEAMYENLRDALDGLRERISLPEATERLVQT